MDPNKQPGEKLTEKPCSILKNSKTPSQSARPSDYVPSPSTETLTKRVSFSTKKLVKKFDQHGALNSSCESSDMSAVSVNASIENVHPVSTFCNETNVLTTDISPEQQSLKRVIGHSPDKENLKKCKLDLAGEDKENFACADMSMTCVLPTSLHLETEPRNTNHQTINGESTRLFRNDEMDMSFTIDIRSSNPIESENIAERLQQAIIEQDEPMDMSMTSAVPQTDFRLNPQLEEELKRLEVPQCDSSLTKSADQSFEMNMFMTCEVPSGNMGAFAKEIAEESGRNFVKCCQAAEPSLNQGDESYEVNMSLTYAVKPKHSQSGNHTNEFLERSNNQSFNSNMSETFAVVSNIRETSENKQVDAEEIRNIIQNINRADSERVEENDENDRTFDANMSETCAVVSKIRETFENEDNNVEETASSQKELKRSSSEQVVENDNDENQNFDANMSETCVVGINRDNFVNEEDVAGTEHVLKRINPSDSEQDRSLTMNVSKKLSSANEDVDVAETERALKRIKRSDSEQDQSLSMDDSKKLSSDSNNDSISCNVRTPSVLNNNMDDSFLQHLAQENRDLLTDDRDPNKQPGEQVTEMPCSDVSEKLSPVNEEGDVAETERASKRIKRSDFEQDRSLSMDVSQKSSSDSNNVSISCNVRTSSVLNNNMDGSFLQHLAQENRDLLTDDSVQNREESLADEQLDDIEEPQTFMSGAGSSSQRHSNNSSLSFDSSRIENYELERKLQDELAPFKQGVNDLANVLASLSKVMREANLLLEMESGTKDHGEPVEMDGVVEIEPDTFEEMKKQVEEISSREDIYWNVLQLTAEKLIVGFISNSLVLVLTWKTDDEVGGNDISDVAIRSRLKANIDDVYVRIAHDFCLHNLKPEFLKVSYTRYEDVVEMINFVYEEVKSTMFMVNDLKVLGYTNITQIQRDSFTIEVNSENYDEYHKITIKIKPIEMIVPDDLKVERILGKAEEHKIRDNVKYVKKDKTFFRMLVHDIKAYLTIVSNN